MTAASIDQWAGALALLTAGLLLLRPVGGLALLAAGALPGVAGRTCRRLGLALTPLLLRRVLAGGTAVVATAAPVAAHAASAPAHPAPADTTRADHTPVLPSGGGWPDLDRGPAPRPPIPARASAPVAADEAHGSGSAPRSAHYRVRTGDCLWRIAAHRLGPQAHDVAVDREWRRWYRLNRAVIGPDPDLIVPGQVLRVPGAAS